MSQSTYISHTGHARILEFTAIESLHSLLQIRSSLKLDKAESRGSASSLSGACRTKGSEDEPFAVGVAARFRVDDIAARLTREIFEVLCPENPRKLKSRFEVETPRFLAAGPQAVSSPGESKSI